MTEDLLTVYLLKASLVYTQYIKERLSQIKALHFLSHYDVLILKHIPYEQKECLHR